MGGDFHDESQSWSLNGTLFGFFQAVFCLTLLPDMSAKRLFRVCVRACVSVGVFSYVQRKCQLCVSVCVL